MSVSSEASSSPMAEQPAPGVTTFKSREKRNQGKMWWSNGIFFISMHNFALFGATNLSPATSIDRRTALLFFISWQLANFGITVE